MTRLLVIDGYDTGGKTLLKGAGATQAGELYKKMLSDFLPSDQIDIAEISLAQAVDIDLSQYDGVCWTGSNLFFSEKDEVVQRHIDLCKQLFDAGIPQFGSCWAAQLAANTAGGAVTANPKGREFGVARKIGLTDAGKAHPMYKGKPPIFDGFTSHSDHITTMPETGTRLAGNSFSPVQAVEVKFSNGEFWAVQYHPEYDFSEIAALTVVRQDGLISQGTFRDSAAVEDFVSELRALNDDDSREDIAWKLGLDTDLRNQSIKTLEVRNWLSHFFNI
ncbi:type 1 glutamine amidotransferase [Leucothrix arctica]|uniref:Glutamine amidotransferase n=1 Tax=Leucothrix arctica TaxID=1481894 RepID=A0A317C5A6_9GAMM|nr:type 1 glutamine amidotransferase [Leucothrix arctica]PWQ93401.1 glutamine amidotransferase [Leucothrix arctica]